MDRTLRLSPDDDLGQHVLQLIRGDRTVCRQFLDERTGNLGKRFPSILPQSFRAGQGARGN